MGLLIALAVLAPFIGGAAVLDWRGRRRRKVGHRTFSPQAVPRREIDLGLDLVELGDG
jgi:hypothetical protein